MFKKPFKFKLGDKVEWAGTEGLVVEVDVFGNQLRVVFIGSDTVWNFSDNGKYVGFHKDPSLKLISRACKCQPTSGE